MKSGERSSTPWHFLYVFIASLLASYGVISLWHGEMFLPMDDDFTLYLRGFPLRVMFSAILCACVGFLAAVMGDYDLERQALYRNVVTVSKTTGCVLSVLAVVAGLVASA